MRAIDLFKAEPWLKVLIYGASGSGKTTWAARAPRPFVILTERQGLSSIVGANQAANVVLVEGSDGYDRFCALVESIVRGHSITIEVEGGPQPAYEFTFEGDTYQVQTIVLDSLSDLHERARAAYDFGDGDVDWRSVQQDVEAFMNDLRDLPINLVTIALAEDKLDDKGRRRVSPLLFGRLSYLVGKWHSATGYAHKRERDGSIEHGVSWRLGAGFETKPAPGFPRYSIASEDEPGNISLGSLVLAAFGTGAHEVCDAASYVERQIASERERAKVRRERPNKQQRSGRPGRKK